MEELDKFLKIELTKLNNVILNKYQFFNDGDVLEFNQYKGVDHIKGVYIVRCGSVITEMEKDVYIDFTRKHADYLDSL